MFYSAKSLQSSHPGALVPILWSSINKLPVSPEYISCPAIIFRIGYFITFTATRADTTPTAPPSLVVVVEELAGTTSKCTTKLQANYFMMHSAFWESNNPIENFIGSKTTFVLAKQ